MSCCVWRWVFWFMALKILFLGRALCDGGLEMAARPAGNSKSAPSLSEWMECAGFKRHSSISICGSGFYIPEPWYWCFGLWVQNLLLPMSIMSCGRMGLCAAVNLVCNLGPEHSAYLTGLWLWALERLWWVYKLPDQPFGTRGRCFEFFFPLPVCFF